MEELKSRIKKVLEKFNLEEKQKKAREIEAESLHPDFWKDHQECFGKNERVVNASKRNCRYYESLKELSATGNFKDAEKLLE